MKNSCLLTLSFDFTVLLSTRPASAVMLLSIWACSIAVSVTKYFEIYWLCQAEWNTVGVRFKKSNIMPVFHSSNLVCRKVLVSPPGEICISFPKAAKNWPNRSEKWWNCKKIHSFYPRIRGFHAPRKVLGMYIYIWVQHVQQHKVALIINSSVSSLPF